MSTDSKSSLERLREFLEKRKEKPEPEVDLLEELGIKVAPKEKKNKHKEQHRQNGGRNVKPKR